MKKKLLSALMGLFIAASVPATAQLAPGEDPPLMSTYMTTPFWLDGKTVPHVMLVLERDWKMFYPAYNNLADLDGDGALDIGYNPKVTYVGYFDSDSCYTYTRRSTSGTPSSEIGLFTRARATMKQTVDLNPDGEEVLQEADVPQIIRDSNLAYPVSKHGVCGQSGTGSRNQGLGEWHGNWLNYAMTSRMDAIRRVLYGGKRTTDTTSQTILEMVRVPANANVWGGELYADDIWEEYAPSSPWYNIKDFTGFEVPVDGAMHFWARGDYFWQYPRYTNDSRGNCSTTGSVDNNSPNPSNTSCQQSSATKNSKPLFRFVANVPSTNRHPFLKVPLRIWDWAGDHASYNSIPSDGHLMNSRNPQGNLNYGFSASPNSLAWHFAARVEVCNKDNMGPDEKCRSYQSHFKPYGLLQEYGESARMYFGLVTGTVSHPTPSNAASGTRYKGGVVRHHIQEFSKYVNEDGTIVRNGLINTIDIFEITGVGSGRSYADGSQAGNPLGEMVWEAVRYLGGKNEGLDPTSDYVPGSESSVTSYEDRSESLTKLSRWNNRPVLEGSASKCPKPIILAISEVIPDHDGDNYPNLSQFAHVPRSTFAAGSESPVPDGVFKIKDYLDIITKVDKLSTEFSKDENVPGDPGKLFFYPDADGLCTARELKNGLSDILGHCPSEPSLLGTYNLAAVAYYAHTHDFGSLGGPDYAPNNIDFFAVGIPGNFPDITLTLDDEHSVTLMPIALTTPTLPASPQTRPEGPADPDFRTLLNFFIEYWQTDDLVPGKTRRIPFKVKFRTNFEYTKTPCYDYDGNSNNWERDLFNSLTISVLTDWTTPFELREGEPLYINSGPFKTRNRTMYLRHREDYRDAVRKAGGDATNVNPEDHFIIESKGGQPYYYAFKKTKGVTLDISDHTVVGVAVHSDTVGSGYGGSGQAGYTITGVANPGGYLDVGLNRSDYPVYYSKNSSCTPDKTVFVPNASYPNCDEAVPLDPSGSGLPGAQWNYANNGTHTQPSGFDAHSSGTTVRTNNADCGYYHPPTMYHKLLTPAECPYAGYKSTDDWTNEPELRAAYSPKPNHLEVCGEWAGGYFGSSFTNRTHTGSNTNEGQVFHTSKMRYVQVRSFKFDETTNRPQVLRNPMWLAAKYGGFKDQNDNGVPDQLGEWIRNANGTGIGDSDPYNYFGVANMSELPDQLGKAFEAIANSVATGTANASSVSQVLGGGVSIQTQYRTEYYDTKDPSIKIKWGGSVYAFFTDKWGNLRADTNGAQPNTGNGKLDLATSPPKPQSPGDPDWSFFKPGITEPGAGANYEIGDLIVHQIEVPAGDTSILKVFLCRDVYGDNNGGNFLPSDDPETPEGLAKYPQYADCQRQIKGLDSIAPLWNAAKRVSEMDVKKRRLYTYYHTESDAGGLQPWPADGVTTWHLASKGVDMFDFPFKSDQVGDDADDPTNLLHLLMGQSSPAETKQLIEYVRGTDFPGKYRSRTVRLPWAGEDADPVVWRMGDIINSRPVIVGEPNSNYQITYKDSSYESYREKQAKRRQVAYFGTNDGILHAVNLGFFGALSGGQAEYTDDTGYELGDELWGFLPPSVLPHLQWMANESYQHTYFVDLKPFIVDVKDGRDDPSIVDDADRWRTIMIVGLRLGGAPIQLTNAKSDSLITYTTPEYFALDVTDPDVSPKLLWRFSDPSLGQTTALPAVVRADKNWYVVLPSGPVQTDKNGKIAYTKAKELYAGRTTGKAKVVILDALTGQYVRTRDTASPPDTSPDPLEVTEDQSYFNDTFTPRAMSYNVDRSTNSWSHHTVYLSMSSRWDKQNDNGGDDSGPANDYDLGAVYRLQMVNDTDGRPVPVDQWKLKRLYQADKPVTGAVNSTYDSLGNLWVLFGTGRIWGQDDMMPCSGPGKEQPTCDDCYQQYVFGIKEPLAVRAGDPNRTYRLTFEEVAKDDKIVDVSGVIVYTNGNISPKVAGYGKYEDLYSHMIRKNDDDTHVVNGYKGQLETWRKDAANWNDTLKAYVKPKELEDVFELITTQIKIDELANGRLNAVVSSYYPSDDICNPLGSSYLMVFDAFTGLPAHYMGLYSSYGGMTEEVDGKTANQVSASKRAGKGISSEAVVLKTDGGTIYRTVGFMGSNTDIIVPQDQSSGNGFISWREVTDMNFDLMWNPDLMYKDLGD